MSALRIVIHGAAGRMGQRLVALTSADDDWQVVAALESPKHPQLGTDVGTAVGVGPLGVKFSDALDVGADVVVDFSVPSGTEAILATCLARSLPLVVATTGLDADQQQNLRAASAKIPILWAPSMSLAVNLAMKLTDVAARALANHASGADVEIIERHHRFKEDAPSGTALKFGEIVVQAMGQSLHRHGRTGRPARPHEEIGYHAVRVGDNPGEHTIIFGLLGETIELAVRATTRDCYAQGAGGS